MEVERAQLNCISCGITFWITKEHQEELIKCHNTFYCPNGHPQLYTGESDRDKIKRLESSLAREREYSNQLARSKAALRGVITKMKKKTSKRRK